MINQRISRIVIRIGQQHLSFSAIDTTQPEPSITYQPHIIKSGMSLPANLREALNDAALQQMGIWKATILVDTPVLLVPIEQFEESTMEAMFCHAFPNKQQLSIHHNVLPELNVVAVFSISKDLNTVLSDNFTSLQIMPVTVPLWRYLHRRSFTGNHNKLYAYLHDHKLDIFSFHQNRFKFCNQFTTRQLQDAVYFLLYVWKQMRMSQENDELHLVGDHSGDELQQLADELKQYLKKVYVINPSAEFNRAHITKVKGLPFDLMTLFMKGR